MPRKKAKAEKTEPEAAAMPLFRRFPAEIQIMIFHEALRKPQVHFINVLRVEYRPGAWGLTLVSRTKGGDTSGGRLLDNIQEVAVFSPIAAEVIRKNALQSLLLPISVRPRGSWKIDAATDLVVLEFDPDKSGQLRFWHPRNQVINLVDIETIRNQLKGIRKVAFVYGGNQQPDAGSSECVFQCLHPQRRHSKWKFCPEELLGLIYQLSDIEAVYFILQHKINSKVVKDYAASYFSVPAAIRNTFGFKTFYSTTRSYITVPLPSYLIGPVFHATWKAKDCIWPNDSPISPLISAARERAMACPPASKVGRYAEHTRKLSYLSRALDHRPEVSLLTAGMIRQMRADQDTPLSPDWPFGPIPPQANTAQFRTRKQHHRQAYNLDNLTKERRDNLEFGMLLMVDETTVYKSGKDKEVEAKAGGSRQEI